MMCWFLKRWSFISEGLFDVIEDAKMGVVSSFQDQQQNHVVVDKIPNHLAGRDTPFRLPVFVDHDVTRCKSPLLPPKSRPSASSPDEEEESSLKNDQKYSKNNGSEELAVGLDKGLDYGELPFSPFVLFEFVFFMKSFYFQLMTSLRSLSRPPLIIMQMKIAFILQLPVSFFSLSFLELILIFDQVDERLLDVSIPTLLDQTFPIESLNADDDEEDVVQPTSISKLGDETETETENDKIYQRILSNNIRS